MWKRKQSKRDKAKRTLASWYRLKPAVLALPVLLFIGLAVPPLARGDALGWALLEAALWGTGIAVLLGLLVGWLAWRVCFRSSGIANIVFSLCVVGSGVWSIALSDVQRAKAQIEVASTIDQQVVRAKQQILAAMD